METPLRSRFVSNIDNMREFQMRFRFDAEPRSVIDGDTIEIHGRRLRLRGIDAPKGRQRCTRPDGTVWRCGQQATLALSDHIGHAVVRCEPRDRDRYRRTAAICFPAGEDPDRWMVADGWALAYRKCSLDHVADEERAHLAQTGIWSGTLRRLGIGVRESSSDEVLAAVGTSRPTRSTGPRGPL